MFKKMSGKDEGSRPDRAHLERLLAEIVRDTPRAEWAALVNHDGLLLAGYPGFPEDRATRISTMSVALSALGKRISSELKNGALRYTVIAGSEETTLAVEFSPAHVLSVGLAPGVSVEEFLSRLPETSLPLQKALHLPGTLEFPGSSQK